MESPFQIQTKITAAATPLQTQNQSHPAPTVLSKSNHIGALVLMQVHRQNLLFPLQNQ